MKRKTIASILIIAMAVSMLVSGCGNKNKEKNTEKNSEAVSEAETETESEIDTEKETESQASSETEIESETQVATNDNSEKESEKVDENKEPTKPTHTCNFATLKTDGSNHWYACSCGKTANKGAHGYDDQYDASCNTCGYTRSVPERPVQPETPAGPGNVSWNGGNINLGNVGISIPTLEDFNNVGLVPGANNWWTGAEGDKKALSDMNVIYYTCDSVMDALHSQGVSKESVNGFTVSQGSIWWSWNGADNHYFELTRNRVNGYYVLTIKQSLKSAPYGNWELSNWNRDIVLTLCSFISSEPQTLYNYIYNGMYGSGTAFNTSVYESVGDCQVKLDKTFYENENGTYIKFYIKGK